ncbi:unnamed protein product [Effrenium voratum]|uniref:Uncharacterized protein n=1 Tax=Effrenium voratum TaxID=2562239 RepID=A0AA36MZC2_9DINO|nr:unnamed protein product [Effrenium voratum]
MCDQSGALSPKQRCGVLEALARRGWFHAELVDRLGFGLAPHGSAASAALLRSAAPLRAPQLAQAALQALRGRRLAVAVAAPLVRSALLAGSLEGLRHLRLRGALKLELGDPRQQRRNSRAWAALCDCAWRLDAQPDAASLGVSGLGLDPATRELLRSWPGQAQPLCGHSENLETSVAAAFARLGCQTLLGERCGHLRLPLLLPDLKITVLCLEAEAMVQDLQSEARWLRPLTQLQVEQLEHRGYKVQILWHWPQDHAAQELVLRKTLASALQAAVPRSRRRGAPS